MSNPFATFRKNQTYWMAALVLVAILAFIVAPAINMVTNRSRGFTQDTSVVANWNGGQITRKEIEDSFRRRVGVRNFLASVAKKVIAAGGKPNVPGFVNRDGQVFVRGINDDISEASVTQGKILLSMAERLGVEFDDAAADSFLKSYCDKKISDVEFNQQLKNAGISIYDLRQIIKQDLTTSTTVSLLQGGAIAPTPDQLWQNFLKLNQQAKVEAYPILVDAFVDKVSKKPTESELRDLYESGKTNFSHPDMPNAGFARREQFNFEYVESNYKAWIPRELAKINEVEMKVEYDRQLAAGLLKVPMDYKAPEAAPNSQPATGATSETQSSSSPSASPTTTTPEQSAPSATPPGTSPAPMPSEASSNASPGTSAPATAPAAPIPDAPAPGTPAPGTPAPGTPAPGTPAPGTPAPGTPAPGTPAPGTPAPGTPVPGTPQGSATRTPSVRLVSFAQELPQQPQPASPSPTAQPTPEQPVTAIPQPPVTTSQEPAPTNPVATGGTPETAPSTTAPTVQQTTPAEPATATAGTQAAATENSTTSATTTGGQAKPTETDLPTAVPAQPQMRDMTYEEARDRILNSLAENYARESSNVASAALQKAMEEYSNKYRHYESMLNANIKGKKLEKPSKPDLKKFAAEYGLVYGETGLTDQVKLAVTPFGGSFSFMNNGQIVANLAGQIPNYYPGSSMTLDGTNYTFWRTEFVPAEVPKFDQVRDYVEEWWRRNEARKLAEEAAVAMSKKLAAGDDPWSAVLRENERSLVVTTDSFSWMSRTGAGPRLTAVPKLDRVGYDFMREVFNADQGKFGVVSNNPKTVYYVFRVLEKTDPTSLRKQFTEDPVHQAPRQLSYMSMPYIDWESLVNKELNVQYQSAL